MFIKDDAIEYDTKIHTMKMLPIQNYTYMKCVWSSMSRIAM